MPEPHEPADRLDGELRRLAERLDEASTPVTAAAARSRVRLGGSLRTSGPGAPLPAGRKVVLAAAAVLLLVVGTVVAVRIGEGGPHRVDTAGDGSSTTAGERPTMTRPGPTSTTTSTSVDDTAPADPGYVGTPWEDLPEVGLTGFGTDGVLHLWDLDGRPLGTAADAGLDRVAVGNAGLRGDLEVGPGMTFAAADADLAEDPPGCEGAAGGGGVRVALCGGQEQVRTQIVRVAPDGTTSLVAGLLDPERHGIGHWAGLLVSPDGRWVLAQWSGECETPSAWFVPLDGGAPRLTTGEADLGTNPNSWAVGWSADGRALVSLDGPDAACGSGDPAPGTYAIDPATGDRELLVPRTDDQAVAGGVFRKVLPGNRPERVAARALAELGLDGCCGEPSHGGPAATTGAIVDGLEITVSVLPEASERPMVAGTDAAPVSLVGGLAAVAFTSEDRPVLAFRCGGDVWRLGAGFDGDVAARDLLELADRLVPHAYCTVGDPPEVG